MGRDTSIRPQICSLAATPIDLHNLLLLKRFGTFFPASPLAVHRYTPAFGRECTEFHTIKSQL